MIPPALIRTVSSSYNRRLPTIVVAACLIVAPTLPAVAAGEVFAGEQISLDLADAELENVLTLLSSITEFIFVVDAQTAAEGGLTRLVTVQYESVPWDQALDEILDEAGLQWTLEGKVLWIHLPSSRPLGDRNFTGEAIRLRLKDADLREVLSTMAKIADLTIDIEPDVEGTVSLNVVDIPWDQTLDLILRITGSGYSRDNTSLRVFRVSELKGKQFLPPSGFDDSDGGDSEQSGRLSVIKKSDID